ncbi:hypothetical protein [Streptomyces chattanoogensis]|uniref:HTH hxlR-type domain-containing protein n=1 Tax=Streptomyces chattanoogensis TaxID=66876 RepID=A0A0N1JXV9_9ACTN|nr:hypothetical protein [Streptomyces chattanoogensis]KPC62635.1 hypothetical protein ADL29_17955 [Streptomyces chattanoogensis]
MTSVANVNHPQVRRAIRALSLPGLIRLVSEIDDNGPISRRRGSLQNTFDDLALPQLRHALDRARDFGVVSCDEHELVRYRLTPSGEDLASVYDTAARWARAHQYPTAASDFVTRVQRTLKLLGQVPADVRDADRMGESAGLLVDRGVVLSTDAVFALGGPQAALAEWLQANPQVLPHVASRAGDAEDGMERAA